MRVLPEGGDSRKQMYMIFTIAVAGCAMFTVYASSLFFKSKSREVGVMMALGATKRQLSRQLLGDVGVVAALGSVAGLLLGTPLSFVIWQIFRLLVVDSVDMSFSISLAGYLWGIAFAVVCVAMLFWMAVRFLRRSNIMDIMNEQRKSEPIRDVK
jgi:ABC-type antimicrobial peptide transport system permease subunit